MSVDDSDVIDFVAFDQEQTQIELVISDHLRWDEDEDGHIETLQRKVYRYLDFIDSGELASTYPAAKGKRLIVTIVAKYPLSARGAEFITFVTDMVNQSGAALQFSHQGSA